MPLIVPYDIKSICAVLVVSNVISSGDIILLLLSRIDTEQLRVAKLCVTLKIPLDKSALTKVSE